MKTKKSLLISFAFVFTISSCEQTDFETMSNKELEPNQANVQLVRIKNVTKDYNSNLNLRPTRAISDWDYPTYYDDFVSIYRYLYYSSYTNIDHLWDTHQSKNISHDGRIYNFEGKEFYILAKGGDQTLYRLYSPSLKDHVLSTSATVSNYQLEAELGRIFKTQEVGTVALQEYYSSTRKKHLYVWRNTEIKDWLPEHDPDFKYVKTVGYVYPGRIDSKKQATQLIFTPHEYFLPKTYWKKIYLTIRAYEGDNIYELEYSATTDSKGGAIFTIPNTYTIIAINGVFDRYYRGQGEAKDLTGFSTSNEYYSAVGWVPGAPAIGLVFKRSINGYAVTITYGEETVLGIQPKTARTN